MKEKLTRRDFAHQGLGGSIALVAGTILDKIFHKDMVPLEEMTRLKESFDQRLDAVMVQHSDDLKYQFERHMEAYSSCLSR